MTFKLVGFSGYLVLFLLRGLSMVSLAVVDWKRKSDQRNGRHVASWAGPEAGEAIGSDEVRVALGVAPLADLEGCSEDDEALDEAVEYHPTALISGWEGSRGEKDEVVPT